LGRRSVFELLYVASKGNEVEYLDR
jgi:hypothetical protein